MLFEISLPGFSELHFFELLMHRGSLTILECQIFGPWALLEFVSITMPHIFFWLWHFLYTFDWFLPLFQLTFSHLTYRPWSCKGELQFWIERWNSSRNKKYVSILVTSQLGPNPIGTYNKNYKSRLKFFLIFPQRNMYSFISFTNSAAAPR